MTGATQPPWVFQPARRPHEDSDLVLTRDFMLQFQAPDQSQEPNYCDS